MSKWNTADARRERRCDAPELIPMRAPKFALTERDRRGNERLVEAIQLMFERFEEKHKFPPGYGKLLILDRGIGRGL